MFWSRLFGFAAVTLCLLAFVCAHGEGNKGTAKEKVKEAKNLTDKVLMKVQGKYREASIIKEKVEFHKERAESAANDAKTAAKDNAEAVAIAEKAKTAVNEYLSLYEEAKQKAQDAFVCANDLFTKAGPLDRNALKLTVSDTASDEECKKLISDAENFKKQAEEIEKNISEATTLITTADSKLSTLSTHAKDAQVAKYQVDAIVKVAEMETMMKKADNDIKTIEQKQNEVNVTVEAIKELFKNISNELQLSINSFRANAERDLSRITNSVKKVKAAQEEMRKQKNDADKALKEIKEETDESKAKQKLESINAYANNAASSLNKINQARQSAVTDAEYANNRKTNAEKEIAKQNSKPNGEDGKTAEKPQMPAKEEGTTTTVTQGTRQTVEDNLKQSVHNEPSQPPKQNTRQTVENNEEHPVKEEPTKPAKNDIKQTVQNEPEQSVKDKVKRFVNNEVLSTSDVINDNAITATVSLPLVLIVFFALHGGY